MTTTSELLEAVAMRLAALAVTYDDGGLVDLKIRDALSEVGVTGVLVVSPELIGRDDQPTTRCEALA